MPRSRARLGRTHERRHSFVVTHPRAEHDEGTDGSDIGQEGLQVSGNDTLAFESVEIVGGPVPDRHKFSFLAKRHVSDPQISKTARAQATINLPPMPAHAPTIITTAPPSEPSDEPLMPSLSPAESNSPQADVELGQREAIASMLQPSVLSIHPLGSSCSENDLSEKASRVQFCEPDKSRLTNLPPAYGDEVNTSLALPVSRLSESSKSDTSLSDHVYASTTTQTVSTTTTFFRLPRRKKNKGPLFPLPVKIPTAESSNSSSRATPTIDPTSSGVQYFSGQPGTQSISGEAAQSPISSPLQITSSDLGRDSVASSGSASPFRTKNRPSAEAHPLKTASHNAYDEGSLPTPTLPSSTRTSTSTTRNSLGGLFNITRLRQNSEPQSRSVHGPQPPLPATPLLSNAKLHPVAAKRELLALPPRQEGDTPAKYLMRLEDIVDRGTVAAVLAQSDDDFVKNVLRSYMRGFKFFGDPLDMSIRKLLMVAELPKETQQIDRVLQAFANRYHECNPGIFASPDETYFIAFSLLILHTDVFNRNNKNKMQKSDYTKNTKGSGVADEILECFYDNISYTPFIRVEDDSTAHGERHAVTKPRKSLFTKQSTDAAGKPSREPVDPYTFILDNKLDHLRPSLKEVMNLENHYTYHNQGTPCQYGLLYRSFFKYGDLQIVSSRSRPDAFMTPETVANPADAHPGVVDIKITKAGILWRKDPKKKKARSPWQEWGAILTGTQLYFFRNSNWVKGLMHQHESQRRRAGDEPIIFRPPLENFKPDVLMSTEDAVALQDVSYKKHKNAFTFVRRGGLEEIFLADNERDLNEWLSNLNYAAAFHTAGVRIRAWTGDTGMSAEQANHPAVDNSKRNDVAGPEINSVATMLAQDSRLAMEIQAARRQILLRKIGEVEERLTEHHSLLEQQLRNARHLQTLAPIQNRTREQVVLAAGAMSARIKWTQIEIWRARCHHDIWLQDLDHEIGHDGARKHRASVTDSSLQTSPSSRSASLGREKRVPAATGPENNSFVCEKRPLTQPIVATGDINDLFDGLQSVPSQASHRPKGSWELPPFPFQPAPSRTNVVWPSIEPGLNSSASQSATASIPPGPPVGHFRVESGNDNIPKSTDGVCASQPEDRVGLKSERSNASILHRPTTPASHDADRLPVTKEYDRSETSESKSRARRSFQRSLREQPSTGPGHSRSKRGKDSASSAVFVESDFAKPEVGTLARSTGSFTLHGKKASVVNLGSEWQTLSSERQRLATDELVNQRLSPMPTGNEVAHSNPSSTARPISLTSLGSNETEISPFEEARNSSVEAHI